MIEPLMVINLIIKFLTSIFCIYNAFEILLAYIKTKNKMKLSIIVLYISICITPILFALNLLIEIDFILLYEINIFFGVITSIALVYLCHEIFLQGIKHAYQIRQIFIYILIAIELTTLILSIFNLLDMLFIILIIYALVMLSLYTTLLYYSIKLYQFLKKDYNKEKNKDNLYYLKYLILMLLFLSAFLIYGINTIDLSGETNNLGEIINGIILFLAVFASYRSFVLPSRLKRLKKYQP